MSNSVDAGWVPALALAAGLLFGASDLIATLFARRHGTAWIAAAVSISSTILLVALTVPRLFEAPLVIPPLWMPALLGIGGGIGYGLLLEAYRRGPIAAVAPIASSIGGVSVVFALGIHGGSPSSQDYFGLVLVAFGALLAASSGGSRDFGLSGPAFAAVGVLCTAIAVVGLEGPIRESGALPVLAVWRIGHSAAITLFAISTRSRSRPAYPALGLAPVALLTVIAAGFLDGSGQMARGIALSTGPTWLIVVLAASGPLVVTAGARVVFRERVRWTQMIGLASVVVGSVTLAV